MLTLALFGAGHVLVAVVAALVIRFLNRQPDLLGRRESVFELNSKTERIEAGEAELAASKAERIAIDKQIKATEDKIADAVPLDDPPSTMVAYATLALILGETEAGVFWLLSGPAKFLTLSPEAWGFGSPPFAAGVIVLLHVLLGWMVAARHRPARTVRRAKIGAAIFSMATAIGIWLTLSGRTLSDVSMIEQLAGAGLMALASVLSVAAAFASVVATTIYEARHHERKLAALETLRTLYDRHIELIEKDLARLRPPSDTADGTVPPSTPNTPNTPPTAGAIAPAGVIPTALMLLCLIGLPIAVKAQPAIQYATTTTTEAFRASVPNSARTGSCEFLPDISGSVDRPQLQFTLDRAAIMMPIIVDALNCSVVRLTPFAGNLGVNTEEIVIPRVPRIEDIQVSCPASNRASPSGRTQAISILYPKVGDAQRQRAAEACAPEKEEARNAFMSKRRAAIVKAAEMLRAIGKMDGQGPCTALPQAVQRGLTRSLHLVAISDGISTCVPPAAIPRVPKDAHLVFLLVPPGGPATAGYANTLMNRLGMLERSFPGSRALMPTEATPSFWESLRNDR